MMLLTTTYLGPVSWYANLYHADEVIIEAHEYYQKQTLRNRCIIATDQGPQMLSAFVEKGNKAKMPIQEVRLSNHNNWQQQHLYAWATYYGASPFYEYYIDDLKEVFLNGHDGTLFGMNEALRKHICNEIGFSPNVRYSTEWLGIPVEGFTSETSDHGDSFKGRQYYQVATVTGKQSFMNNMSILDLLFNLGPESLVYLDKYFEK